MNVSMHSRRGATDACEQSEINLWVCRRAGTQKRGRRRGTGGGAAPWSTITPQRRVPLHCWFILSRPLLPPESHVNRQHALRRSCNTLLDESRATPKLPSIVGAHAQCHHHDYWLIGGGQPAGKGRCAGGAAGARLRGLRGAVARPGAGAHPRRLPGALRAPTLFPHTQYEEEGYTWRLAGL
jgi:hypothetical protein